MLNHPNRHDRHSVRLEGYDYSLAGAYFVTLVSWKRGCLFGECTEGKMRLNSIGNVVHSVWEKLAFHFPQVRLEEFTILPNHLHGIIVIKSPEKDRPSSVGATRPWVNKFVDNQVALENGLNDSHDGSPLLEITRPTGPERGSLGAIIGQLKSRITKRIWRLPGIDHIPIWQRNYYEHIIRDAQEYQQIMQYIETNPLQWVTDKYY